MRSDLEWPAAPHRGLESYLLAALWYGDFNNGPLKSVLLVRKEQGFFGVALSVSKHHRGCALGHTALCR